MSVTAPTSGATVSGTVTVSATAADNKGVAGVKFLVDGNLIADDTSSAGGWGVSWNTTTVTNGTHTLTAVARDAAGNTATSTGVQVTVNNPDIQAPTVNFTAPTNGATVSGSTVTVTATAADNKGVAGVKFLADGNLIADDTSSAGGWGVSWNTTTVTNGTHTLTAVARDAAGNTATSAPVNVTVANAANNRAPAITWSAGTPDPTTAAVTGSLTFSDPDGDALTHTISQPYSGTLDFNAATGVFTYTPSYDARVQVALYSESNTDSFRVGVSDGKITTYADVDVPIGTGQLPPIGYGEPPEVRSADPATGTVTGGLNLFDPNGDRLTYTVVRAPGGGTATVDASGIYSYTPNASARAAGGVDSFAVAISDGTGTTNVDVTVPIRPIELASTQALIPNVGGPVAESGSRAYYVQLAYNGTLNWTVKAVDTNTNTVIATSAPIAPYGNITPDVAVSPDGTRIYLANPTSGPGGQKIYVLDSSTLAQVGTPISVGTWPTVIAVSPNGTRLYVGNEIDDNVQVFDTSTQGLVATIPIGSAGYLTEMVISRDGSRVYVADGAYNKVTVVDAGNNTVLGSIVGNPPPAGRDPAAIALSPDGQRLYVTNTLEGTVSIFDTATRTLVGTPIPVGVPNYLASTILRPTGITVSSDGKRVYVARADDIVVIDAASRAVVGAIRVDQPPPDLDWMPVGQDIFIASDGDLYVNVSGGVKAVNVGTTQTAATVSTAGNPL